MEREIAEPQSHGAMCLVAHLRLTLQAQTDALLKQVEETGEPFPLYRGESKPQSGDAL